MRDAPSPAGLLTLLVVAAAFLLASLLAVEHVRNEGADPAAQRALREAEEALRALPSGSPLLAVPEGARMGSFSGEIPGGPTEWESDWTVQALRWDTARGLFVPVPGGLPHELTRVSVRVRAKRGPGALAEAVSPSRSFLRAGEVP